MTDHSGRLPTSKRLFDIFVSSAGLAILSPVILLVAIVVYATSPGGALFRQQRLGLHGRTFTIVKFRTMKHGSNATGSGVMTSADDPRLTPVGSFLRASGLDELPQLWNVLRGDMSVVGPRPPVPHHPYKFDEYPSWAVKRFSVRPGLTGLAQVSGRNVLIWDERIKHDVHYVDSFDWKLDLQIIWKTVRVLNRRFGLRAKET